MKPLKNKKCRHCKDEFTPWSSTQVACSPICAIELTKVKERRKQQKAEREDRRELRKRKEAARPRSWYTKEAQKWFNKYIRLRDSKCACISCGRHHDGQYHAGHYKTAGGNPELRFEELNCHKQCAPCNNHLSGNIANYRVNLIGKIGLDKVEWLEGPHDLKRYTIDDLKDIIELYKKKCKELQAVSVPSSGGFFKTSTS